MQRSTVEAGLDATSAEAGLDAASAEAVSDAAWNVSPVSDSFFISERTKNKRPGVGGEERWQKVRPMAKCSPKVTKMIANQKQKRLGIKHEVVPSVAMVHAWFLPVDPRALLCN